MSLSLEDLLEFFPPSPLEIHTVGTTRKVKFCGFCDETIERGRAHMAIVWRTGDGYRSQTPVCDGCFDKHQSTIIEITSAGGVSKWNSDLKTS